MKKAVIAVAVVLVFIFTLTQKSEAVPAANWIALSGYLNDTNDYSSNPIELTADITNIGNFTLFTLSADKKITSNTSKSLFFIFSPPPPTAIRYFGFRQQKVDVSKS
ncbi:MAG: hypothetical protein LBB93_03255 [Elusimicrobiota bacterium]|jgi:hypothetical protein|nr:hypothetical protein [Elusimicrobiota bacterium]